MYATFRLIIRVLTPAPPPPRSSQRQRARATPPPSRAVRPSPITDKHTLSGKCYVIDGDTIVVAKTRIRLAGIDAPELDHPWGQKSKSAVISMCLGQTITVKITGEPSYDRVVARCFLPDGRDIAAELVKAGLAIDWPKFSGGRYRDLEPEGIRKKLWRADAKQRGRLH